MILLMIFTLWWAHNVPDTTTGQHKRPSAVNRFPFGGHVIGGRRKQSSAQMPSKRPNRYIGHSLGQIASVKATCKAQGCSGGRLAAWNGVHGGFDVGPD